MSQRKRLPPFAKYLTVRPDRFIRVFAGTGAWQRAKAVHAESLKNRLLKNCLLLPPREAPTDFHWPVLGQMVMIIPCNDFPMTERAALAAALLRDGATAGLFTDTQDWFGILPADSPYWKNKKPA